MSKDDIVRYQIMTHCYTNKIPITESDLSCLTLLAIHGEEELTEFCIIATEKRIFKSTQTVRNCLVKLEKAGLITKDGKSKKRRISVNQDIKIQSTGNIVLNYKFYHIES